MTKAAFCRHVYFDLPCTDILKNRLENVILKKLIITSVHRGASYLKGSNCKVFCASPTLWSEHQSPLVSPEAWALEHRLQFICASVCPDKTWTLKPDLETHAYNPRTQEAEAVPIQSWLGLCGETLSHKEALNLFSKPVYLAGEMSHIYTYREKCVQREGYNEEPQEWVFRSNLKTPNSCGCWDAYYLNPTSKPSVRSGLHLRLTGNLKRS